MVRTYTLTYIRSQFYAIFNSAFHMLLSFAHMRSWHQVWNAILLKHWVMKFRGFLIWNVNDNVMNTSFHSFVSQKHTERGSINQNKVNSNATVLFLHEWEIQLNVCFFLFTAAVILRSNVHPFLEYVWFVRVKITRISPKAVDRIFETFGFKMCVLIDSLSLQKTYFGIKTGRVFGSLRRSFGARRVEITKNACRSVPMEIVWENIRTLAVKLVQKTDPNRSNAVWLNFDRVRISFSDSLEIHCAAYICCKIIFCFSATGAIEHNRERWFRLHSHLMMNLMEWRWNNNSNIH